jgi:hypothetical protein
MKFEHTSTTKDIRSDDELIALYLMACEIQAVHGKYGDVDSLEYQFRATPGFERGVKAVAAWLLEYKQHVLSEEQKRKDQSTAKAYDSGPMPEREDFHDGGKYHP